MPRLLHFLSLVIILSFFTAASGRTILLTREENDATIAQSRRDSSPKTISLEMRSTNVDNYEPCIKRNPDIKFAHHCHTRFSAIKVQAGKLEDVTTVKRRKQCAECCLMHQNCSSSSFHIPSNACQMYSIHVKQLLPLLEHDTGNEDYLLADKDCYVQALCAPPNRHRRKEWARRPKEE